MNPCRKFQYPTSKLANEDAIRIQKKNTDVYDRLRPYFCLNCKSWHLTKQDDKKEKEISNLLTQVKELKLKVKELEQGTKREVQKEIAKDDLVKSLQLRMVEKDKTIRELRAAVSNLVSKLPK